MSNPSEVWRRDRLRTFSEAAAELGGSDRWFRDFIKTIPPCHLQKGNRRLFDDEAMDALKAAMRQAAKERGKNPPPLHGKQRALGERAP